MQIDRNGINNGIAQDIPGPIAQGWYSFSVDVYGEDGNWSGSGVHCNFNNGDGGAFNFGFAVNNDTGERYGDIGNAMRRYTWMFYNPRQSNGATLYLMAGWSGFQGDANFGFVRTIWHGITMRSSSEGEIVGKKVKSENLIARVQTSEGAISTLNGKNTAWLTQDVSAGDGRAIVSLRADGQTGSSNIDLAASSIRLFNPAGGDGSYIPALTVSNNNAVFSGAITASSYTLLSGGQRWRFQFASQDFQASNNQVIVTPNFGALPKVEFGACPVSLGANEVYQPRAENLSNTGFTAKLEILVPGTPSNYSLSGDYDGGNGLRARYLDGNPSSASGNYTIQAYGTASAFWAGGNTMPDDGGYVAVILGIFAYKNGAWTQVTTAYAFADIYLGGTKGTKTANWYLNDTFQLGGGVTHVAVQYQGREGGTAASLNNLTGVAWQAAGSSAGVRSATPNGEKVTVKVTPQ